MDQEKKEPDQKQEQKEESSIAKSTGNLTGPEAVAMFAIAVLLDLVGLVLLCFALDDFWITDAIGAVLIGGWMFFRMGRVITTKRAGKVVKKSGKKILKRLGLSFFVEIVPWVGGIAPCWTLAVYFELKNN